MNRNYRQFYLKSLSFALLLALALFLFYFLVLPHYTHLKQSVSFPSIILELFWFVICPYVIALLISGKPLFSALVITIAYVIWLGANFAKAHYLGTAITPADFQDFDELFFEGWVVFRKMLPFILFAILLITTILGVTYRRERKNISGYYLPVLGLALFVIWTFFLRSEEGTLLTFEANIHASLKQSVIHGFGNHFLQTLRSHNRIRTPKNYSRQAIKAIIEKYHLKPFRTEFTHSENKTSLITLLVESLTDPEFMGWEFSEDPLPNFHHLQQTTHQKGQNVISPVYGGKSVNAEFEILTGMSLHFIPPEKKPYRLYIKQRISSLPHSLGLHHYSTYALHVVGVGLFFSQVYKYLEINQLDTLKGKTTDLAPNGLPSSRATLKKISQLTTTLRPPFYIHSFPNATHAPWSGLDYGDNRITLLNKQGLTSAQVSQIEGYVNALKAFDTALGSLIKDLKMTSQSITLVVIGDHQPGLSFYSKNYEQKLRNKLPLLSEDVVHHMATHHVPLLIWNNQVGSPLNEKFTGSMNALPPFILKAIGIEPHGFLQFVDILRQEIPFSSQIFYNREIFSFKLPKNQQELMNEYELLQYDILHGEQYFYAIEKE